MLGMWKPTPNRYILLQQITNSHGNKGYSKHTEENRSLGLLVFLMPDRIYIPQAHRINAVALFAMGVGYLLK